MSALSGSLKEFGIAEVLQLIGLQKKTGILYVKQDPEPIEIQLHFSEGMIMAAQKAQDGEKVQGLAIRLMKSELVSREAMEEAKRLETETLKPLEHILLEMNAISKETLLGAARLELMETVFELFHLKDGTYEFDAQFVGHDPELSIAVGTEQVTMDGFRIVDEMPVVARNLPDMDRIYAAVDHTPDKIACLSDEQKKIHGLLGIPRSLLDMTYLTGAGKFETMKCMSDMLGQGFITAVEGEDSYSASGQGLFGGKLQDHEDKIAYVVLALVVALTLWTIISSIGRHYSPPETLSKIEAQNATVRIKQALEAYRLRMGEYPGSLESVIKEGLIAPSDIKLAGSVVKYHKQADRGGYELIALSPEAENALEE